MAKAICVTGWDEGFRDMAVGDGIVTPSVLLLGVVADGVDADALLARVERRINRGAPAKVPGSGVMTPCLEVRDYDPLDFVPGQNKWQYNRSDTHARIVHEAKDRRRRLGL